MTRSSPCQRPYKSLLICAVCGVTSSGRTKGRNGFSCRGKWPSSLITATAPGPLAVSTLACNAVSTGYCIRKFCRKNGQTAHRSAVISGPAVVRTGELPCLCCWSRIKSMKFPQKSLPEVQVCRLQSLNSQFRSSHLHRYADVSITSDRVVSAGFVRTAKRFVRRGFRRNLLQGSDRALPELQFPGQGWSWFGHQKTELRDHCRQGLPAGWLPLPAPARG